MSKFIIPDVFSPEPDMVIEPSETVEKAVAIGGILASLHAHASQREISTKQRPSLDEMMKMAYHMIEMKDMHEGEYWSEDTDAIAELMVRFAGIMDQ